MAKSRTSRAMLGVILLVATACGYSRSPVTPSVQLQPAPDAPARTASSPGQYSVGVHIEPGRYFSAPSLSGCRYQLDGVVGGPSVNVNFFGSFTPRQWIVDILPSDKTFRTASDCGTWFKDLPRHGVQAGIPPGTWVVGSQIAPGTYTTVAVGECAFYRLRNFHGLAADSVIEPGYAFNEMVWVTIEAADTGFSTFSECGTWSRESSSVSSGVSRK